MSESPNPEPGRFRFACPGCSADMEFDPGAGALKCPYCGHIQPVEAESAPAAGHPFEEHASRVRRLSDKALELECPGCGSQVVFTPPVVAGSCSFCGAKIVAQPRAADPVIAPDAVLPASVPKEKAVASVKHWLASRWFAPNALARMARQDGINGVYLPHWSYDTNTFTAYQGQRGEYYYVTETYQDRDAQGRPITRTRQVRHTRWHAAWGNVSREFENVLVSGTKSVSAPRLAALEPWDLGALVPYEPAYLAGFQAQRYQSGLEEAFEAAKGIMRPHIEDDVRRDIGGDEQRILSMDTEYRDVRFRHLLLPVWLGAYRFSGKVYQTMVNARTGEVQGERPYSAWKIAGFVLFLAIVVLLLVLLSRG